MHRPSLPPCVRLAVAAGLSALLAAQTPTAPAAPPQQQVSAPPANPYRLEPFHADFPVELQYPTRNGLDYNRTRRQALARVVANLQGNSSREAWQMAMEFFWDGPEDAVELLVEAMDAAFGNPALADVVRNCVEAMGKMANPALDGALQRALEHKNPNVRQATLTALATSGSVGTLRNLEPLFPQMDARSRTAWLRAVRTRLGAEGIPILRTLMQRDFHSSVRDQVLAEALRLPPKDAAAVLEGRWEQAIGEFKPVIAGVFHAAGITSGTVWLQETLTGEDLAALGPAIRHCAFGDVGVLREHLLQLSSHPRPEIRYEVAKVLVRVDGDDVAAVFESLAGNEETHEIRAIALRELTRRGRPQLATSMLDEVPTATGTRLTILLNQLAQSGDQRAVPLFVDRFREAPPGQGRAFLQSLALLRGPAATAALVELFLGEERLVDRGPSGETYTTLNYLPLLLLNLRGSEAQLIAAFQTIPKSDWKHRAALLPTIAGLASDREDPALVAAIVPLLRAILHDRSELPQLRVLAQNQLQRRYLSIEDAMALKNNRFEEAASMRVLWCDVLQEYF